VKRLSGRFRSALIIGGQGIRARKLRTLLSMLSLFLGVLAVVAVQAGAEIGKRAMLSNVELTQGKDGTLEMGLPPEPAAVPIALETLRGRADAVATTSTRAIIGEPGVSPVNPGGRPFDLPGGGGYPDGYPGGGYEVYCDPSGNCTPVAFGAPKGQDTPPAGMAIELELTAMTGDVRQFKPFRPQSGQWLDFASAPSLSPRLVLNKAAAKGFGMYAVPAEMRVEGSVANATPRIIGVVDDGRYEPAAYVRADELLTWLTPGDLGNPRLGGGVQVLMSPKATDVEYTLRARLAAAGVSTQGLQARRIDALESNAKELALVRSIFLAMAGLVLLIGVAGILNVGLATVGERVEEFALRRAVGTPRSLLAGIVLAETLFTGLFTAALAIGTGILGLRVLSATFLDQQELLRDLSFPWQAGVAGVIAGLLAGLLGGLIPALRAARIPIATVMRA